MDDELIPTTIYQSGHRIIIVKDGEPISKMAGGVLVICRTCREQEIVNEGSLCDQWKLCKSCASKKVDTELQGIGRR